MKKIGLILASNHELWWEGLLLLLAKEEDLEPLSICYDTKSVLEKAVRNKPDIILVDEEISGGDCGTLVSSINDLNPDIKVIVIIKPYKNILLSSCLSAKVNGFLAKDITYKEIAVTIRQIAKGGFVILSPRMAREFIDRLYLYELYKPDIQFDIYSHLSGREREVLTLLAIESISITNKEIAAKLYITESTVKSHLRNILKKMKVRSRHEAALRAREQIKYVESANHINLAGQVDNKVGMRV